MTILVIVITTLLFYYIIGTFEIGKGIERAGDEMDKIENAMMKREVLKGNLKNSNEEGKRNDS